MMEKRVQSRSRAGGVTNHHVGGDEMLLGREGRLPWLTSCVAVRSGNILFTSRNDSNHRVVPRYRSGTRWYTVGHSRRRLSLVRQIRPTPRRFWQISAAVMRPSVFGSCWCLKLIPNDGQDLRVLNLPRRVESG